MGKFIFEKTDIDGVYIITPTLFGDNRGYFMETYSKRDMD
jgi:dTDP-4-dehydrorhamnose 3,5-epimerase